MVCGLLIGGLAGWQICGQMWEERVKRERMRRDGR